MAIYVKGNAVENATSYELLEKTADGEYSSLATASEINFEVSALGLTPGDHTFVVKAKADGYEDSDASNEVVYTVEDTGEVDLTEAFTSLFAAGAIYGDPADTNFGGAHTAQTAYQGNTSNSGYVSLVDYSEKIAAGAKLQITMPYAVNSAHTKYGICFYSGTGKANAVGGLGMEYTDGKPAAKVVEIDIPTNAKYVRTTWHTDANEATCGVAFSAKLLY